MTDGLLQMILDAPDDDAPRLVYADALEERGEVEHAEFIRVQLRLARLRIPYGAGPGAEALKGERDDLRLRERELFTADCREWGLGGEWRHTVCASTLDKYDHKAALFRRGFVEAVSCRLSDWCGGPCGECGGVMPTASDCPNPSCEGGRTPGHGPALVRCQPVRQVRASDREPYEIAGGWCWYDGSRRPPHEIHPESVLPGDVFALLDGYDDPDDLEGYTYKSYPTEADARAALSAALVRWAKKGGRSEG